MTADDIVLLWALLNTLAITKSLKYSVLNRPAPTKSLKYTTKTTPSAPTKSLKYCVQAPTVTKTKTLIYEVKKVTAITKSLQYIIKRSPAITKSLTYGFKASLAATKSLKYGVKKTYAITKALRYFVNNTASSTWVLSDLESKTARWSKATGASSTMSIVDVGAPYNHVLRMQNPASGDIEVHRNLLPASGANPYKGFAAIELDIDLHGSSLVTGDASAFGFDQAGWKYVSLSNYVTQGQNGMQHVFIPMDDLKAAGLDEDTVSQFLIIRIWSTSALTVDIDNIKFTHGPVVNYTQPTLPAKGTKATWNLQAIDTMKWSKDKMDSQLSDSEITAQINKIASLGVTHITVDVPYDDASSYSPAVTDGYKGKIVSAVRAASKKVWHRAHWNSWEGDWGFAKRTPTSVSPIALGTAKNVLNGTDTSSYLYKTYNYIKTHSSEFAAGDIFTPVAEVENSGVGPLTTDMFVNNQALWEFMRDSITVCNEAFKDIGLDGQVFIGFWGNSGYTALNRLDERTADSASYLCIDHYVFTTSQMQTDLTTMEGYFNLPVVIGEWSDYTESDQTINATKVSDMYEVFQQDTNIKGVNYWNDIYGSYESLYNNDGSRKPNSYVVELFFQGRTIATTKSLTYDVKVLSSLSKTLQYSIATSQIDDITLSWLLITPTAITQSLKYTIKPTAPKVTKSLKYGVPTTHALTASLRYSVRPPRTIMDSLKYTTKVKRAATKSLIYDLRYTPALSYLTDESGNYILQEDGSKIVLVPELTKSLRYSVKASIAKTKSLKYTTGAYASSFSKSLRYGVVTAHALTKSLRYILPGQPIVETVSLRYAVKKTYAITKSLQYEPVVTTAHSVTKTLIYDIKKNVAITKLVGYRVKTSTFLIKLFRYATKTITAKTKSLKYTIFTTPPVTKVLRYGIATTTSQTKSLRYQTKLITAITKSNQYTIFKRYTATLNQSYYILKTAAKTLSLYYYVPEPGLLSKTLRYAVSPSAQVTKSLVYKVKSPKSTIRVLVYEVVRPKSITKALNYVARPVQVTDLTKALKYTVKAAKSISKSIKYSIKLGTFAITKSLKYSAKPRTTITKSLLYVMTPRPHQLTLKMKYDVIKDRHIKKYTDTSDSYGTYYGVPDDLYIKKYIPE